MQRVMGGIGVRFRAIDASMALSVMLLPLRNIFMSDCDAALLYRWWWIRFALQLAVAYQ